MGQDDPGEERYGSRVLSILAGDAPGRLIGVAHEASYLLAKTEKMTQNGQRFERRIEEDWWIEGLEWLEKLGADVVSCSLGYSDWYRFKDLDGKTAKVTIAADLAVQKGVCVIVAAGNSGGQPSGDLGLAGHIIPPADGFNVLAIGGVDSHGKTVGFSSPGPTYDGRIKPDLMALGDGVSTIDPSTPNGFLNNSNGTSFAAPLAAGVVTLLMQAFPLATPSEIADALRSTASQADRPDNNAGYGIIRARAAYEVLVNCE